jgi:transposase
MTMIGGLDVHRAQITYDWVDACTGQARRGQVAPAHRLAVRQWLAGLPCAEGDFALEGCTGWRYVTEELVRAGYVAHVAEPAETADRRGSKRRAKTDKTDAKHLRELLEDDRLPESWIPSGHILDLRQVTRLRKSLSDIRGEWQQRIHAIVFHHGLPQPERGLLHADTRSWLARPGVLPAAGHAVIWAGYAQIDNAVAQLQPLDRWIAAYARAQPGCRALIARHWGVGELTAVMILAETGDARRFPNGDAMVRYTGLDVTVYSSDGKRGPGRLARQGPAALRWALYEAAKCHSRAGAPHLDLYRHAKRRKGGKRATLTVARKLAREIRHTLIDLGDDALAPVDAERLPALPAPDRPAAAAA